MKRTGIGLEIYIIMYTIRLTVWPMPVASAAPSIPIRGNMPSPNISTGSSIILVMQPVSMAVIETVIRPTA